MKRIAVAVAIAMIFATCAACAESPGKNLTPIITGSPASGDNDGVKVIVENPPEAYLRLAARTFMAGNMITYTYVNETETPVNILSIPRLERLSEEGGWVVVPFCENVGFCGTPDTVEAKSHSIQWSLDAELLYGGALETGTYRLTFAVLDDDFTEIDTISNEFDVVAISMRLA